MNPFTFNTTPGLRFGAGVLNEIGSLAAARLGARAFLVTDAGMVATGVVARAQKRLEEAGVEVMLFTDVVADPPSAVILKSVELAALSRATGVIGLGGGSSLDVAKLVALLAPGRERLEDVFGVGNARGPRLPLMLIPTTAGTGSEVTPISIVTTGAQEKMGVVSPLLLPDLALLDPELTLGLPAAVTAATGIDAMVHAIEAYASKNANNNPLSRHLAAQALGLIGGALETAVKEGANLQARSDMLLGSMLAGQAFANSPVAAVHALAYPLGGHFHIPHGLSNALVLPHVLRFNVETAPHAYAQMAPFAFPGIHSAEAFVDALADLSARCGLPQRLRDVGVPDHMLSTLARDAMNQTRLLPNNPRAVGLADALAIYRAAW